tara:strand:- start:182 stop:2413 length:2232 start_codon:yes stop_codon:yes gene_type:complete
MSKLLIVESPAKAKTISKYLDDKYTVIASVGHVRDLPKSNKKAIDIDKNFTPHYEPVKGKEKTIDEIQKLAKSSKEVLLATDPDREGEAIAWHVKELANLKKPQRVVFNEITKEAVQEALKHPRTIDDNLRKAQEARRVLDRLVGYDLSGLIWKKVRYGLSAGRVQSPALRIIMEREREIREFVPEEFFVITADVKGGKKQFGVTCSEEPKKEDEAERILSVGKAGSWSVSDIEEKNTKRSPRAPFITSTLQQAASSRLGFAPSRTMGIAQKLYESGHITYMRTDSVTIGNATLGIIRSLIAEEYGKEYVETRVFKTKSKNAQEAHEAIRPTNISKRSAGNTPEQKKLYELIWKRTIASQMSDAKLLATKIITKVEPTKGEDKVPDFTVTGSRILFDGWLRVDTESRGEDVELPAVEKCEELKLLNIESERKETKPLGRYTEAGLIKELEKREIGRPSTYASIMRTLSDRGYVEKEGRTLFPTDTGDVVSSFLEKNFENYISDSFTAEMEHKLDEIAEGNLTYEKTLKDFYTPFSKEIDHKTDDIKITDLGDAPEEFRCPKCDSTMVIKLGKRGKFMSCNKFPDCDGARTIEGKEIKDAEPIGKDPETGENVYLLDGRFGPYVQLGENPSTLRQAQGGEQGRTTGSGRGKKKEKPRRGSVPKDKSPEEVTLEDALKYLSLPRELGVHPDTENPIIASVGRFGPYVMHDGDFRSLKTDDVYTINLKRALEILSEEKKRRGAKKK